MKINRSLRIINNGDFLFAYFERTFLSIILLLAITCSSCRRFTEIDPPISSLTGETVFSGEITATSAITGIYIRMIQSPFGSLSGEQSINLFSGLYTDELQNFLSTLDQVDFFENQLHSENYFILSFWSEMYQYVYTANTIIEKLEKATTLSSNLKKQLKGEALFIRAFSYFHLVNLFGDVPLITKSDYKTNALVPRAPVADIYDQMVEDLKEAQNLLGDQYASINGERTRPNKATATALLARIYLYMGDWANAEIQASTVINDGRYNLLTDLNNVFLKGSQEAIWQLASMELGSNTWDGLRFILTSAPTRVSSTLYLINSFEVGDNRRSKWVGSITPSMVTYYYPFKYKLRFTSGVPAAEYLILFRLAEQYLIRAEARVKQGNISGAQVDINAIRNRAGLANTTANNQSLLLSAIEQERRIEFFSEMGHRFFDLKRTGRIDAVISPVKPNWGSTDALLPIPQVEVIRNPNIVQNPGY